MSEPQPAPGQNDSVNPFAPPAGAPPAGAPPAGAPPAAPPVASPVSGPAPAAQPGPPAYGAAAGYGPAYGTPYPVAPAPGPYGSPYPTARPTVPSGIATAAIILAAVWMAYRAVLALSSWASVGAWEDAAASGLAYIDTGWLPYDSASPLTVPLTVAMYVVGCVWLYRSRVFAEADNPGARHARSRVWVWLGWWVPVVSLWFPFQVVRDVRQATITYPRSGLGAWWACWLGVNLLDQMISRMLGGLLGTDPLTESVSAVPVLETVAAVLTAVAGLLWISYVRELRAAQRSRVAS